MTDNQLLFSNYSCAYEAPSMSHSILNYMETKIPCLGMPNIFFSNLEVQNSSKQWAFNESYENRSFTTQQANSVKQNSEFSTDKKQRKKKNKIVEQKVKNAKQQKKQTIKDLESSRRNSGSNIFRAFIKFCSKPRFQNILRENFQITKASQNFTISFEYFIFRVKEIAPSTSNYVNLREFKKICDDMSHFSQIFRRLFHWFANKNAISHCLTLKGKNRMMQSSIKCFLNNLHTIEEQVWEQKNKSSEQ